MRFNVDYRSVVSNRTRMALVEQSFLRSLLLIGVPTERILKINFLSGSLILEAITQSLSTLNTINSAAEDGRLQISFDNVVVASGDGTAAAASSSSSSSDNAGLIAAVVVGIVVVAVIIGAVIWRRQAHRGHKISAMGTSTANSSRGRTRGRSVGGDSQSQSTAGLHVQDLELMPVITLDSNLLDPRMRLSTGASLSNVSYNPLFEDEDVDDDGNAVLDERALVATYFHEQEVENELLPEWLQTTKFGNFLPEGVSPADLAAKKPSRTGRKHASSTSTLGGQSALSVPSPLLRTLAPYAQDAALDADATDPACTFSLHCACFSCREKRRAEQQAEDNRGPGRNETDSLLSSVGAMVGLPVHSLLSTAETSTDLEESVTKTHLERITRDFASHGKLTLTDYVKLSKLGFSQRQVDSELALRCQSLHGIHIVPEHDRRAMRRTSALDVDSGVAALEAVAGFGGVGGDDDDDSFGGPACTLGPNCPCPACSINRATKKTEGSFTLKNRSETESLLGNISQLMRSDSARSAGSGLRRTSVLSLGSNSGAMDIDVDDDNDDNFEKYLPGLGVARGRGAAAVAAASSTRALAKRTPAQVMQDIASCTLTADCLCQNCRTRRRLQAEEAAAQRSAQQDTDALLANVHAMAGGSGAGGDVDDMAIDWDELARLQALAAAAATTQDQSEQTATPPLTLSTRARPTASAAPNRAGAESSDDDGGDGGDGKPSMTSDRSSRSRNAPHRVKFAAEPSTASTASTIASSSSFATVGPARRAGPPCTGDTQTCPCRNCFAERRRQSQGPAPSSSVREPAAASEPREAEPSASAGSTKRFVDMEVTGTEANLDDLMAALKADIHESMYDDTRL